MGRVTRRKYAADLYPHADECEVRDLAIEVPYRHADFVGHGTDGTGWHDLLRLFEPGSVGRSVAAQLTMARIRLLMHKAEIAALADALSRGMTGDEAWRWAMSRAMGEMDAIYERAVDLGIPVVDIKPYPCGPEPGHHDHRIPSESGGGWYRLQRVPGPESACEDCTTEDGA